MDELTFDDWFVENENSNILNDEYQEYTFDQELMGFIPMSFVEWMRDKFYYLVS